MALTIRPGLTGIIGRAARRLARTSTVLYLAGSLPGSWRAYLQRRLSRLRRIANVYDYATRLEFADSAGPGSRRFRVVVYGAFFEIWNAALVAPKLWEDIPGVVEVLRVADRSSLNLPAQLRSDVCTVIIPLGEEHYRERPQRYRSLVPDARSVATLSNKASFAAYIDELGLSKLCPRNYKRIEDVEFPVVLKRVDLAGSMGVEFVRSKADLDSLLKTPMFLGHKILMQAFVSGAKEYVTHCVCKDGDILWSCTFAWDLGSVTQFGIPVFGATVAVTTPRRVLPCLAAILGPLRYSGPCCMNYKVLPDGEIAIFEINPRLGGSLMNPRNIDFLRQAMTHLVYNAR